MVGGAERWVKSRERKSGSCRGEQPQPPSLHPSPCGGHSLFGTVLGFWCAVFDRAPYGRSPLTLWAAGAPRSPPPAP